jgi:hypothetical protein
MRTAVSAKVMKAQVPPRSATANCASAVISKNNVLASLDDSDLSRFMTIPRSTVKNPQNAQQQIAKKARPRTMA